MFLAEKEGGKRWQTFKDIQEQYSNIQKSIFHVVFSVETPRAGQIQFWTFKGILETNQYLDDKALFFLLFFWIKCP